MYPKNLQLLLDKTDWVGVENYVNYLKKILVILLLNINTFLKHVATDWDDFKNSYTYSATNNDIKYIDPKFPPYITEKQYEDEANLLAQSPAGRRI